MAVATLSLMKLVTSQSSYGRRWAGLSGLNRETADNLGGTALTAPVKVLGNAIRIPIGVNEAPAVTEEPTAEAILRLCCGVRVCHSGMLVTGVLYCMRSRRHEATQADTRNSKCDSECDSPDLTHGIPPSLVAINRFDCSFTILAIYLCIVNNIFIY